MQVPCLWRRLAVESQWRAESVLCFSLNFKVAVQSAEPISGFTTQLTAESTASVLYLSNGGISAACRAQLQMLIGVIVGSQIYPPHHLGQDSQFASSSRSRGERDCAPKSSLHQQDMFTGKE